MYEKEARERQLAGLKRGQTLPVTAQVQERDKGEAAEHAAKAVGVSARMIQDAKAVKDRPKTSPSWKR